MKLKKPYTKIQYLDFIEYCNTHNCVPKETDDGWESVSVVIDKEQKLSALDTEYQIKRNELKSYYVDFIIEDDIVSANEIKAELIQLETDYANEYKSIKESE